MIKLKDLITEQSSLTVRQQQERDHISKMPTGKIRNAMAVVANRMSARWYGMNAHEYITMHKDELKKRGVVTEVSRLDEAAAAQVIMGTVGLIRWEVLQNHPELTNWIKPQLRRIENAVKKMKR